MSSYDEALSILREALTFGIEPSLDGITALARRLGNPQLRYPCIQVAGTNGKSSTARFAAAFLRAQGKRVGLYTSPELVEYPERMEVDGAVVSRERFADAILAAHEAAEQAIAAGEVALITEFELLTAAALWLFADERVDFAVLEVGLGGRWDATSIVNPKVAVITGIDLDHTAILGNSVERIAAEKAAIIKAGCAAVLGPGTAAVREVFRVRCEEVGVVPLIVGAGADGAAGQWGRYLCPAALATGQRYRPHCPAHCLEPVSLATLRSFPRYQEQNIACALAATTAALGHEPEATAIRCALDTVSIPGRFELVRPAPPLLIDASHNPQSARVLAEALIERYGQDEATGRLNTFDTLLLGILSDKDAAGIIAALVPLFAHIVATRTAPPRAIPADELAGLVASLSGRRPEVYPSVADALSALTNRNAAVVATGSITLAGEVKRLAAITERKGR